MCEQVVAATPGVEEVVFAGDCCLSSCTQRRICVILVWLLSPGSCTQRRVCVILIWLLSPGKAYPPLFRPRAPLLREGSDIGSVVIPLHRVEVVITHKRFWHRYVGNFRIHGWHRYTGITTDWTAVQAQSQSILRILPVLRMEGMLPCFGLWVPQASFCNECECRSCACGRLDQCR